MGKGTSTLGIVLAVVGAVVGTLITGGFGTAAGWAWGWSAAGGLFAGASIGMAVGTAIDPPKPASINFGTMSDYGSQYGRSGPLVTQMSNKTPVMVVYGHMKMAGNIIWKSNDNTTLKLILLLCNGPVESITDIRINDVVYTTYTGVVITPYLGTTTQVKDSIVGTSEGLDLRNYAYLAITCPFSDELSGNQTYTCIIEGEKIGVPRILNGSTEVDHDKYYYDADNSQYKLLSDDTILSWDGTTYVTKFSENPAMIVRDIFLKFLNKTTADIDEESFITCFNWFLGKVKDGEGGYQQRYRINYTLDSFRSAKDHLSDILYSCDAIIIQEGSKIKMLCDKKEVVSHNFGDGSSFDTNRYDNIKDGSFSWSLGSFQDNPNRIIVQWFDPDQEYNQVSTEYNDRIDQEAKNNLVISKQYFMPGIQYQAQAARMAKRLANKIKFNRVTINWIGFNDAKHLQLYDVVTVTHKMALYQDKKFKITRIEPGNNEEIAFSAVEYNEYIYDDRQGAVIFSQVNPDGPNYFKKLSDVTNLVVTETGYQQGTDSNKGDGKHVAQILLTWTPISDDQRLRMQSYMIQYSEDDGLTYKGNFLISRNQSEFTIPDLKVGKTYIVKVKTISDEGVISNGTISSAITLIGKDAPPPDITGFSVNFNKFNNELIFTWDDIDRLIPDLQGYEIRVGGDTWNTSAVVNTNITGKEYRSSSYSKGLKTYYIKAIDYSGNYSVNASEDTINITNVFEENIIIRHQEWENLLYFKNQPNQGTVSSTMRIDTTNDYDAKYYRNVLTPKTTLDWAELDALGYTCNEADNAKLQMDTYTTTIATYETQSIEIASIPLIGTMSLDYTSASENRETSIIIEYSISDDNITWSSYKSFIAADVTARYLKFKISLQTANIEKYIRLTNFNVVFDVPDITDEDKDVQISSDGTNISFKVSFSLTPRTVIATVVGASGSRSPIITNLTTTGFTCYIYDKTDTAVNDKINWFAKGGGGIA